MKNNNHKKMVFQDNFIKHWCCSSRNHPEGWSWRKRHNRKVTRLILDNELSLEMKISDNEDSSATVLNNRTKRALAEVADRSAC